MFDSFFSGGFFSDGFFKSAIVYADQLLIIPNNNVNTEAYMRSGNLVARYETNTLPVRTYLTATLTSGVTASMTVAGADRAALYSIIKQKPEFDGAQDA
jgi:hypothetical protein